LSLQAWVPIFSTSPENKSDKEASIVYKANLMLDEPLLMVNTEPLFDLVIAGC
jgi:hypothetical protein